MDQVHSVLPVIIHVQHALEEAVLNA
jgi:hypothetical protein